MPASTLQPMTEVAYPVIARAAVIPHAGERAVITTRAACMSKASANVSPIRTPRRSIVSASTDPILFLLDRPLRLQS
jgi:hypothetical protein